MSNIIGLTTHEKLTIWSVGFHCVGHLLVYMESMKRERLFTTVTADKVEHGVNQIRISPPLQHKIHVLTVSFGKQIAFYAFSFVL